MQHHSAPRLGEVTCFYLLPRMIASSKRNTNWSSLPAGVHPPVERQRLGRPGLCLLWASICLIDEMWQGRRLDASKKTEIFYAIALRRPVYFGNGRRHNIFFYPFCWVSPQNLWGVNCRAIPQSIHSQAPPT